MSVKVFFPLPTTHSKMAEVPSSIDLLSFHLWSYASACRPDKCADSMFWLRTATDVAMSTCLASK